MHHSRPSSLDSPAAVPNRYVQSGVAMAGIGSHNVASQTSAVVQTSQPTIPPVGQGSSSATLVSHPSVAVPNLTAITPLLVSNLIPSDLRKPPEVSIMRGIRAVKPLTLVGVVIRFLFLQFTVKEMVLPFLMT